MKSRLLLYTILFISFVRITGAETPSSTNCNFEVNLDTHVHNMSLEIKSVKKEMALFLKRSCSKLSFVISPSYSVDDLYVKNANKQILKMDSTTSELVQSYPNRLLGLCGISYDSVYAVDNISRCLSLKGMIGLKIRIGEVNNADGITKFFQAIDRKLNEMETPPSIILAHLPHLHGFRRKPGRPLYTEEEENEDIRLLHSSIGDFLNLAESLPKTQFLVAHSLYDPREVKVLADKMKVRKLTNIWIETSTSLSNMMPFKNLEPSGQNTFSAYVDAWKYFGIHRVVFGSDSLLGDTSEGQWGYTSVERNRAEDAIDNYNRELSKILNLKNLEPYEKMMILSENSRELKSKINRTRDVE